MNSMLTANLLHHPGRTIASVAGISVGVILVVLTVGLIRGMLRDRGERDTNTGVELMVGRRDQVGISLSSLPMTLPVKTMEELRSFEGVRATTAVGQYLEMKGESGLGLRQLDGVEFAEFAAATNIRITNGDPLPSAGDYVIVDVRFARDHRLNPGDQLTIFDRQFKISGIYEPETGSRIMVPLATLQEELGRPGLCSMILVKLADPSRQDEVAARILEKRPDYRVIFTRDLPALFADGYGSLNLFLNLVTGLSVVISLLVISLTMFTTVTERTRQIGILKSLGASKSYIITIFLKESLLICVIGISVGLLLASLLRMALVTGLGLSLSWEPDYAAYAAIGGVVSGLIGALYPAWRAARVDAVDALSYE
ncbi:MAG: ABC transporter permease [Acidobacteria bacterium]|nr:ABC transporter permease [Acidobacteriota bacterium]